MSKEHLVTPENFFRIYKPGSDVDGVVAFTKKSVTDVFNKEFGTNHKPEEIRSWFTVADWAEKLGMGKREAMAINNKYWYEPEVLFAAPLIPGAFEFTATLSHDGINLPFITSRPFFLNGRKVPGMKESTIEWFKQNLPHVKENQIYMQEVDEMGGEIFKVFTVQCLGRGIFFEDVPSHAKLILDYSKAIVVLLSNSAVLDADYLAGGRLTRISKEDGSIPDLHLVNQMFFVNHRFPMSHNIDIGPVEV